MQVALDVLRALADEARLRSLLALREGELCVCQFVQVLGLAPSTVSKHLSLLQRAGLVRMRKQGRWHYYRLPEEDAPPHVQSILRWVFERLKDEHIVVSDAARLGCIREQDVEELAACYRAGDG